VSNMPIPAALPVFLRQSEITLGIVLHAGLGVKDHGPGHPTFGAMSGPAGAVTITD
jgi:hypothetical protein